jgi:asparagine synthase (glutamine-hydrolysing)
MEVTYEGVRSGTYWSCRFEAAKRLDDLDAAATAVTRCLDETTRLMCRSDVPVGAALSGGLDSGAVVDSMSRALSGVHTFRISGGFDSNPEEYAASERIAQWCGTQHHQCSLPPDCVISFTNVASIFGEPISSPVILDALELAKQARSRATVLLTGTGGDELFGGYPDHWVLRRLDRERALRRHWHVGTVGRAGSRPANQRRADLAALRPGRVFGELKFSGLLDFTQRVYAPRMKEVAAEHDPVDLCETVFLASGAESLVDGFLAQELTLVNQYSLTSILDAAGMHHSLEFRSPFLDVNMIELSLRIPSHFKIGPGREGMNRKLVLRRAMQNRLPPQTVLASTKTGFGGTTPYGAWLRGDKEAEFHRRLTSPALNDLKLFDTRALEELALLSTASSAVPLPWLWGVAMISGWLERYF